MFRKMGEEQLKEMVCKVEDVDGGWRDYGTVARDLLEERGFNFKYPGDVCGKEGGGQRRERTGKEREEKKRKTNAAVALEP